MSPDAAYDRNNVFARIARGDAWCASVYEDAKALAFMDAYPQAEGHVLVISKKSRARDILEVEAATLSELGLVVRRIARAIQAVMNPDGIAIVQFNGRAAGQTVAHFHFHIIPCWSEFPMRGPGAGKAAEPEHLQYLARRLAATLD